MRGSPAASAVVALAVGAGEGSVCVLGDGREADELARRLGTRRWTGGEPPVVVIETAGSERSIQAALERVADLGVVVLAGPPPPTAVALDLYADLHVRGLTLIGMSADDDPA